MEIYRHGKWIRFGGRMRLALGLLLLASPLSAQMRWTPSNVAWGGLASSAIVADCVSTHAFLARSPDNIERNPILGGRPSTGYLNLVCGAGMLTTWFVAHQLRAKDRKWLFLSVALVETGATLWNLKR